MEKICCVYVCKKQVQNTTDLFYQKLLYKIRKNDFLSFIIILIK